VWPFCHCTHTRTRTVVAHLLPVLQTRRCLDSVPGTPCTTLLVGDRFVYTLPAPPLRSAAAFLFAHLHFSRSPTAAAPCVDQHHTRVMERAHHLHAYWLGGSIYTTTLHLPHAPASVYNTHCHTASPPHFRTAYDTQRLPALHTPPVQFPDVELT